MPTRSHRSPDTSSVVRAASAGQFLGLVPHLVGSQPRNSLVLVVFTGKRSSSAIRVNLPTSASPQAIKRVATTFIGIVCKIKGADGVMPVVYTDESFGPDGVPHAELLDTITDRARRAGLRVTDALCVAADAYGSTFDRDLPVGGRPLTDIVETDVGRPLRSEIPDDALLPEVSADVTTRFRQHVAGMWELSVDQLHADRALRRLVGPGRSPDVPRATPDEIDVAARRVAEVHRFDDVRNWDDSDEEMLFDDDPASDQVSFVESARSESPVWMLESLIAERAEWQLRHALALASALADLPYLRDIVLLTIAWGRAFGEYAHERGVLRADEPLTEQDAMAMAFSGGDMARPSPTRVERGIQVLSDAAAMTEPADRAPLLSMVAWLHWTLGRGTMAGRFVDLARRIDPAYGLAELLDRMLSAGMLPEWAYRDMPIGEVGRRWQRILTAEVDEAA